MQRRSNAAVFMKWATKERGPVIVWTTLLLIAVSLALGFAAWLLFLWAVKSDQYDDVERPKHRMLDDDDEVRDTDGESRRGKERTDESRRV